MSRFDHSKQNGRDRIVRQGVDNIEDFSLPGGLTPPRPRASKASLRAEAEAAVASITRLLHCPCGHSATILVTPAMTERRFRCSKCGEVAE